MNNPDLGRKTFKKIRKFYLNGLYLEIGYHHGLRTLFAEFHLLNVPGHGGWGHILADTPRDLIRRTRLEIARRSNPQIAEVLEIMGLK